MGPLGRFLLALGNMVKTGGIRKIEDAFNMAKQEFGEVTPLLKKQIEKVFSDAKSPKGIVSLKKKPEGEVIEASFKPGMDKRGKVVEESPSQASGTSIDQEDFLRRIGKQIEEDRKTLGPISKETKEGGITYSIPEKGIIREKGSAETIMDRLMGASNRLRELQKEREAMFKPKNFNITEGLTRTIARRILDKKNIQIGKRDPIDVYSDIFGEAVSDVKNLADELIEIDAAGGGTKNLDEMIKKEGLFDIDIPENPQRGMSDDEFIKFLKDKGVDPDDTGFASGGRVQYAFGSGMKLAGFLAIRGKTLKDEIRKAIQNLNVSGDRKLDADIAVDDMLEELGTSRDQLDQKDILDAYDKAYNMLTKEIQMTKELAPKMTERMELKAKYPGIDDETLDQIIEMDPAKKAEMFADMEMGAKLIEQGRGVDEVKDIIEKGVKTRKDNAGGGLNYLMGM